LTDGLVETLRVRGPGAARLGRVAAVALPAALDRSLAGLPDARIDSLSIRLELDPDQYDDVTLATLWADAIRQELMRRLELEGRRTPAPGPIASFRASTDSGALGLADAVAASRAWLADAYKGRAVPVDALAIAERVAETPLAAHDEDLGRLLIAIATALDAPRRSAGTAESPREGTGPATEASPSSLAPSQWLEGPATSGDREPEGAVGESGSETTPSLGAPDAATVSAAAARIAALSALVEPESLSLDLDTVTSAAGLALLYPWLADLCRAAVELHPGLDEAAVRAHALAVLVDPDDPGLVTDPLVGFLAGLGEPLSLQSALPHDDELRVNAERALASFASLLPGFAESSPDFVRNEWIHRTGLVDFELDPARLTAATHPLDVVLSRLPYPLSLFKLPWSPALMVRFRP